MRHLVILKYSALSAKYIPKDDIHLVQIRLIIFSVKHKAPIRNTQLIDVIH